jgi:PAS domain S-box-containing protein
MKTEVERLRELLAINRAIAGTEDYDTILRLIVDKARDLTEARASLLLLGEPGTLASIVASVGIEPERVRDFRGALDERITAVLRQQLELGLDEAIVAVPLNGRGHLYGILAVIRPREAGGAGETDHRSTVRASLLSVLADQAAMALGQTTHVHDISEARRLVREREQLLAREQEARRQVEAANEQLRDSEERFRLTIEGAPIGMALVALDGRFVRVNRALCEIVGYEPEELTRLTFQAITFPDDLGTDLALVGRLIGGEVSRYQLGKRYVRKDGRIVDAMLSVSILRGRDDAPLYFISQIEDVTGRKRAEAEREHLLQIEQQHGVELQAIREASLAISELQSAGAIKVPDVLRSIVEQARRLTGADYGALGIGTDPSKPFDVWVFSGISGTQAERIGRTPRPFSVVGIVPQTDRAVRLSGIGEQPHEVAFPPHHPPMDAFLGVPIRHRGRAVGNVYLAKPPGAPPFTEEDQSVVELLAGHAAIAIENARLYDELQVAVRAREELLAVVSHDLKTPLSAISIREEMLAREHADDPRMGAHAQSVSRSLAKMQRMIRGLLDAASLDAGQLRLQMGEHDLSALVGEVVELMVPIADGRDVTIESWMARGGRVRCDRERMIQVLSNLVGNAIKFTPPHGVVTIRAEPLDSELLVAVADTGVGIPAEALSHVFDRFYTRGGAGPGTGLGLHIAKRLVEAHGGRIWATSAPGQGSTFFFTIPEQRIGDRVPSMEAH